MAQRNGPAHAELRTTRRLVTTPHLISCHLILPYLTLSHSPHPTPPHLTLLRLLIPVLIILSSHILAVPSKDGNIL